MPLVIKCFFNFTNLCLWCWRKHVDINASLISHLRCSDFDVEKTYIYNTSWITCLWCPDFDVEKPYIILPDLCLWCSDFHVENRYNSSTDLLSLMLKTCKFCRSHLWCSDFNYEIIVSWHSCLCVCGSCVASHVWRACICGQSDLQFYRGWFVGWLQSITPSYYHRLWLCRTPNDGSPLHSRGLLCLPLTTTAK